ncbi:hypothetical protein IT417_00245 [bacterium]|nr:hypothetical protein [bacterium]
MELNQIAIMGVDVLGVGEFDANVEELKKFGLRPSESYTCCATGTCNDD